MLKPLLSYIREHALMRAGDRVGIAVSGGADSVALFRAILALRDELGILLSVVHVHHGIRGAEADADAEFVASLAGEHGLKLHSRHADVPAYAEEHGLSLEAAGRAVRYHYFAELLSNTLDRVATAHTRDDQAETVLLRLIRGAGTRGLAGIYRATTDDLQGAPSKPSFSLGGVVDFERNEDSRRIVRPLLDTTRTAIEAYLRELSQPWREDGTNADRAFLRNRVRHELLPMLERDFNPNIRQILAQTAEVARDEEAWWSAEVGRLSIGEANSSFPVPAFTTLHPALQRRVLRALAEAAGESLGIDAIERARAFVLATAGGTWPISGTLSLELRRFRAGDPRFSFHNSANLRETQESPYEYELRIPGSVAVPEFGVCIRATSVSRDCEGALSASLLGRTLLVRNWRAGDRFHARGRGGEKKIKELFQIYRIPAGKRANWPVVEYDGEIVWVLDMPPSEKWDPKPEEASSILLEALPLSADSESS